MVGGIHKAAKDNTYKNLEYINLKKTLDVNLRFLTASHIIPVLRKKIKLSFE